jgi:hypothetical protein
MEDLYRSQFRLPGALYEQLKEAAQREGRSINAEVVARLQQTFAARHGAAALPDLVEQRLVAEREATDQKLRTLERELRRYMDEAIRGRPAKAAKRRRA